MHSLAPLVSVAMLWTLAALSPGPNFLITVRIALTQPRRVSLQAVAGIATGTCLWGLAGFLGIHSLFIAIPWAYGALKIVGGAYLAWLGLKLAWNSRTTGAEISGHASSSVTGLTAFRLGLTTNLANPKTAVFVAGLFAATMSASAPLSEGLLAIALMAVISLGWYTVVAFLFTSAHVSKIYVRARHWIDRAAGACFVFFGVRLITSEM